MVVCSTLSPSMDNNLPPPALPPRPGMPIRQVQGIESLRPEARPNDYVDTCSLTPKVSPRTVHQHPKDKSNSESKSIKNKELQQNLNNELKERRKQNCFAVAAPPLPPRGESAHPPPIPTRLNRTLPPITKPDPHLDFYSVRATTHCTLPKPKQPATVLIFSKGLPSTNSPITRQPTQMRDMTIEMDKRSGEMKSSIICPRCGECRCSSCTSDRQLPERWLCEDTCRCTASSVVDVTSCMYCARSIIQRCSCTSDNHSTNNSSSDICACSVTTDCCVRWTALGFLSLVLPCMCCYWPLQGGVAVATACYNSSCCRRKGCTCSKS